MRLISYILIKYQRSLTSPWICIPARTHSISGLIWSLETTIFILKIMHVVMPPNPTVFAGSVDPISAREQIMPTTLLHASPPPSDCQTFASYGPGLDNFWNNIYHWSGLVTQFVRIRECSMKCIDCFILQRLVQIQAFIWNRFCCTFCICTDVNAKIKAA